MDTLIVVGSDDQARELRRGQPKGSRVVWPGAALMGSRFDKIVTYWTPETDRDEEWYQSAVLTCLKPGGEVVHR